jgi:colanic acid/amylovoran biosynthesis glycosyltransferase
VARGGQVRLLVVGLTWPPETFLRWKYRGLVERGYRITAAVSYVEDPGARIEGVRVVRMANPDAGALALALGLARNGLALAVSSPRRLARTLRLCGVRPLRRLHHFLVLARLRGDVVHFEWEGSAVDHLPLLGVWEMPVAMSCHGGLHVYVHAPARRRMVDGLAAAFEAASAVAGVSRAVLAEARARGLDPAKALLVPTAVDPAVFSPDRSLSPRDPRELHVVAVSWLRWLKGLEWAVAAVAELCERGVPVRLDVLGGDPQPPLGEASERERLLWAAEDLGVRDRVRLRGHLPSEELVAELRQAHVLLHPSLSEGVPTVVLEAMACALPVVVTDVGGVSEAVTDGVEGLVVPARDPSALADALERLWRDAQLRQVMGRAGRARVERDFRLDRQVESFAALYSSLIGRAEPAPAPPAPDPTPSLPL